MDRVTTRPTPAYAPGLRIRAMTLDDCAAVADIRVRGWQAAYAGMVPQEYLDGMDVAEDTGRRRAYLSAGGPAVNLVVETPDTTLTGWACYGPCRDEGAPPGSAELYALYAHPDRIGTGVGRSLLTEVVSRASAEGFGGMALRVLRENERARRFYEQAGFRPDGTAEAFEAAGTLVPEVRYIRPLTPPAAA
ncbi:GNAT family N-acetyltransferase [Streptomyces sp. NPDC058193]|uniref:GNAT family N-acetyltransferase n=1 Tax=Streptomyces sp. NPDC058193 TaxID=3346373 RepID=UPI0036ECDFFE